MSDDSKDPKSVFDAETVIWSIGDKSQKKSDAAEDMAPTEVTKKAATRSKINIFDDDSTVRARPESKIQIPSISFEFLKNIPWANLRKIFGLPIAGLALGMILFFGASQYLKNKTPELEPKTEKVSQSQNTPVRSEVVRTETTPSDLKVDPVKKDVAVVPGTDKKATPLIGSTSTKSNVAEIRSVRTTDEFLSNLSQALHDSRRSATRP